MSIHVINVSVDVVIMSTAVVIVSSHIRTAAIDMIMMSIGFVINGVHHLLIICVDTNSASLMIWHELRKSHDFFVNFQTCSMAVH